MKLSQKRKEVIETLYREYHGKETLGEKNDVDWLKRTFSLTKKQAQGVVDFVQFEGYRLPEYRYYLYSMNNSSEIWKYYKEIE